MGFSLGTVEDRVHPCCPFSHRTRPPETELPRLQVHSRPPIDALFCLAAVAQTSTQFAEMAPPLDRAPDYSATTLASIIVPAIMTSHLRPVPQSPMGIATNKKKTTIPGQTPRHQFLLGPQTAGFLIRPLAPQGLRYPRNVYGLSGKPTGMSQSHSKNVLRLRRKDVPMCSFHPLLSLQLHSRRTGASVLLRNTIQRPPEGVPTLQEPLPDKSLSVLDDKRRTANSTSHPKPSTTRDRKLRLPRTPSVSRRRHPPKQSRLQTTKPFLRIGRIWILVFRKKPSGTFFRPTAWPLLRTTVRLPSFSIH